MYENEFPSDFQGLFRNSENMNIYSGSIRKKLKVSVIELLLDNQVFFLFKDNLKFGKFSNCLANLPNLG